MSGRLLIGDSREKLRELPDASVHCCVTSPPYFGLRDYGHEGQMGLEPTPDEFVAGMVGLFREVRRVLRDDGTLWLNLGDSYVANATGNLGTKVAFGGGHANQAAAFDRPDKTGFGLAAKQLIGIPWRVAFALQSDGWYLRQDIIWAKPNPMPESVRDRCTKSHEYIFMLSKKPKYFFDAEAVKEPAVGGERRPQKKRPNRSESLPPRHAQYEAEHTALDAFQHGGKRNKRDVWQVASRPFKEAHFATFPPDLIEPCILAGTSAEGVCGDCGTPWQRQVKRKAMVLDRSERTHEKGRTRSSGTMLEPPTTTTTGWQPGCDCNARRVPATVLDPFFGAGTTGLVAERHGRQWIGCELNPEYAAIAERRIAAARPERPGIGHNSGALLASLIAV